ncbi:MAG: SUF system Fe-S cluster assembly protein, partial [Novosphingobium sp.]|nr:SUF system Fe-S cluster assembly protein [Novosphingobium sp.]
MVPAPRSEVVTSVPAPPRARVSDAEAPAEKLERKRDYLEGFLARKPDEIPAGEPGGEIHEAVIAALKDIYDPE